MRRITPFVLMCGFICSTAGAANTTQPRNLAQSVIDRGVAYLRSQQKADGSWNRTDADPPAITALVLKALVQDPALPGDRTFIDRGYKNLLSYQKPDGGIYRDLIPNYNTAIAISALAAAKNPAFNAAQQKALTFLRGLQWTDQIAGISNQRQQVPPSDPRYGGFGYGNRSRPDGSNMQIALDALHDSGLSCDDPAFKAALAFASRLQNRAQSNDQPWAGNDGGFIYTDADGGSSPAGEYTDSDGKKMFRSYGSMTYAGLKSMIYAGLNKDDPRVDAAINWIRSNWTWDENPGIRFGNGNPSVSGLYYYYQTASRALSAYAEPIITDTNGKQHDWRAELIAKIASLQRPDGSWVGQSRWMESNPVLATSFAVLSLEEAQRNLGGK